MSIRLNKLLAQRGIGARRKCDVLIQEGAVRVNGRVVLEPGTRVEPDRDRVSVRGRPLPARAALRYFVLHKPVGVISTLSDPEQRRTVAEFLPPGARVFPVGRLDADTSGLLILTNDGELAHHLMHPRYGVEKVYRVRLARGPSSGQLEALRRGVEFEPGIVSAPCRVRPLESSGEHAILEIAIHEGRYRQVRRMCEAIGLRVLALHRSAYGPLRLGPIERGMWRELSVEEVRRLKESAARPLARPAGRRARGRLARQRPATESGARWRRPSRTGEPAQPRSHEPRPDLGRSETPRGRRGDVESRRPRPAPRRERLRDVATQHGRPEPRRGRRGNVEAHRARPEPPHGRRGDFKTPHARAEAQRGRRADVGTPRDRGRPRREADTRNDRPRKPRGIGSANDRRRPPRSESRGAPHRKDRAGIERREGSRRGASGEKARKPAGPRSRGPRSGPGKRPRAF